MITHFEHFPTFCNLRPDSIGLRFLFQLRVSLSSLRSHKRCNNFIDTPSDICHCNQGIEDTNHYLFTCPTYLNQRAALVVSINEILRENNSNQLRNYLRLYLYGHVSISPSDNRLILMSTITYIKGPQRFST